MAIFIPYPISTRDTHISLRADMGVSGWYRVWYENCHIIIYLSYIFSFWQVCLFDIVCGVKGKTTDCSECGDMGFYLPEQKKLYHPPDLVIWFFCLGKNAVSPMWSGDMGFLPLQKSCITHMTHFHTFCTPQEWYVLESRVSTTYAKWTYFLVNVW